MGAMAVAAAEISRLPYALCFSWWSRWVPAVYASVRPKLAGGALYVADQA